MEQANKLSVLGGVFLLLISLSLAVAANGGSADAGGLRQRGQASRSQGEALKGQYQAIKNKQANLEAEKAQLAARSERIRKRSNQLQDEFYQKFNGMMAGGLEEKAKYDLFIVLARKWFGEFNQDLVNIDGRRKEIQGEMAQLE